MKFLPAVLFLVLVGCAQTGSDAPIAASDATATNGAAGKHLAMVDDANFAAEVLNSDQPVLVDFWAPWCGPCQKLTPIIEQVAEEFTGRAKVVKVNIDDSQQTAQEYGVTAIPLLVFFRNGEVVKEMTGLQSKEKITEVLNSL